jgi:phage tail-like protein
VRRTEDPYGAFNFMVEIDGIATAGFQEVVGLDNETAVIEYRVGDERGGTRKLPGLTTYSNLVLKRGWTTSTGLWEWRQQVIDGQIDRRNLSVILLDESRQEVTRWNVFNAWPCAWRGPLFHASKNAVAIEALELSHEGFELG